FAACASLTRRPSAAARNAPSTHMYCYVYILGNDGGRNYQTYVGWTTDLDRRLWEHNSGCGAKSTRGRSWVLLYAERYEARSAAMSREWHLKRDKAFRRSLRGNWRSAISAR